MSKRRGVDIELVPNANHYELNELWCKHIKPLVPEFAELILRQGIKRLEEQYLTQCCWQKAGRTGDNVTWHRSAIEPHEQDDYEETVDVLIDAVRDCLEWMVANQPESAANWCDRLIQSEVPILRRMAVHIVSERTDLSDDEKCQWLLDKDIHDIAAHHEIFRLLNFIYAGSGDSNRKKLLDKIFSFRWTGDGDEQNDERTAYEHFKWVSWLEKADSSCQILQEKLKDLARRYPDFGVSEHPDMTHWTSMSAVESQSPWTVEQLLVKPADEWLPELLAFKGEDFFGPNRRGLTTAVIEATKQDFRWGVSLAEALIATDEWASSLWSGLIQSWSDMVLDEARHREVLSLVGRRELYLEHPREIAQALFAIVRAEGKPHAFDLLDVVNSAADDLWKCLNRDEEEPETKDWLQKAINHPGGILAEFWLHSLSLWRKAQDPKPESFNDVYDHAFTEIVEEQSLAGKLGRSVLAGQLAFLMTSDRPWSIKYLLPLYDHETSPDDFQSAWDGFLGWGRLNSDVVDSLKPSFLKATRYLNNILSSRLNRFVEYYTAVILSGIENPLIDWVPELFRYGGMDARHKFSTAITRHLRKTDDTEQVVLWDSWFRRYWENRIQNVPAPLESEEIKFMLGWLPKFSTLFPQAVALAVRMPKVPFERFHLIYDLKKSNLVERYPEEVMTLLSYLAETGSPGYIWHGLKDILDRLGNLDLEANSRERLEGLSARLGVFDQ